VTETNTAEPGTGFAELGLDSRLAAPLAALGYSDPTPIQREAIPPLLAGRDLVGLAATGTGKTAAFALPLLQRLSACPHGRPAALILVPTRELAVQVAAAVGKYGKPVKASVLAVYGGTGFREQARAIRHGIDVIVATPGRALDHLRRGTLTLGDITIVVLDEADEMLDMGFAEDIEAILSATPAGRQTMLFSATMPPRISAIANKHLTNPVRISVAAPAPVAGAAPKVRQVAYVVPRGFKNAALLRVLDHETPASALVFCRTRSEADGLADALAERGLRPEALHGGMTQEQRDRVMCKFRDGSTTLLVATDVAARGLDIGHLSHVINYHVPPAAETYVHRIGRVGRAGREGVAITFAEPRDRHQLRQIERVTRQPIAPGRVPTAADLRGRQLERTRDALRETIRAGGLEPFLAVLAPLADEFQAAAVAAAALALATKGQRPVDDGPDIPEVESPRPQRDRRPEVPRFAPRGRLGGRGMARVFIGAGRSEGVGRRELVAAFEDTAGLGSRDIGTIEVAERFSLVEVPGELTDYVIDALQGVRFRGRPVVVRRDRDLRPVRA
jgi:ATP-dependent RNA helicase DeaD